MVTCNWVLVFGLSFVCLLFVWGFGFFSKGLLGFFCCCLFVCGFFFLGGCCWVFLLLLFFGGFICFRQIPGIHAS